MPLQRTSLRSFLTTAKYALHHPTSQSLPLTFIIGNESADLDSLCSAVILAYLRTYAPTSKTLYIPLSNLPRSDLSLRPELSPVLRHAHLEPSDLITLSDLPTTPLSPEETQWVLVDHNALQGKLGQSYGARLVGCIDHHDEEHKVPERCDGEPRIVRKSGSCTSLVVEYCRAAWDALAKESTGSEKRIWDAEVARLALAPILIDTTNLTVESRTTSADEESVKYLEQWITAHAGEYDRTGYFEEITHAKENIGGLSLRDIFRKDYKEWTQAGSTILGISSVVKDMAYLLEKAGGKEKLFDALNDYAKERDLSICAIMTTSHADDVFRRELLVWARDETGAQAVKKFEGEAKSKLGVATWDSGSLDLDIKDQYRRCWWQKEVAHSRKQVAPLLREAIGE